jgi:hypothetical protein
MAGTQWGSGDDPERTEVLRRRTSRPLPPSADPDKTVVIASSPGVPAYPPAPPPYHQHLGPYPVLPARPGRGQLWAVLAIGAVALCAMAVVLIVRAGPIKSLTADRLEITAAQAGVRNVLADPATGYGLAGVNDVTCNHGVDPTIFKGTSFTCELTINGHQLQTTVTFVDDRGTYSVGRPE